MALERVSAFLALVTAVISLVAWAALIVLWLTRRKGDWWDIVSYVLSLAISGLMAAIYGAALFAPADETLDAALLFTPGVILLLVLLLSYGISSYQYESAAEIVRRIRTQIGAIEQKLDSLEAYRGSQSRH